MREKHFQQLVVECARLLGWRVYHTHDSRRSEAGFPDLVLVRGTRLLFVELKANDGRLDGAQAVWLDDLRRVADAIDAGAGEILVETWRPDDWDHVHSVLKSVGPEVVVR